VWSSFFSLLFAVCGGGAVGSPPDDDTDDDVNVSIVDGLDDDFLDGGGFMLKEASVSLSWCSSPDAECVRFDMLCCAV
jgi:hypothetical protein